MKAAIIIIIFCLAILNLSARTIVDMAGRTVKIPESIDRIFPYDSKTSILLFPLLGDKMVATSKLPGKKNFKYISKLYAAMPEVDAKNMEEVLMVAPQLIIAGFYDQKNNNEGVEKLGSRLSIPVVFIDLSIDKLDQSYRFLGQLFNRISDGDKYASFLHDVYFQIDSLKKRCDISRATTYYALGASGLLTDPSGSKHTEVFDLMNIPNVAKVEIPSGGHAEVNMEQVLMWNPNYIFAARFSDNSTAFHSITSDAKWKSLLAVKNQRVYQVPDEPFAWFDHPPSINRIPGVIWLCKIFYGQSEEKNCNTIKAFYKLFYKYDLSQSQYESLFK